MWIIQWPKANLVPQGDGARTHREDVAEDSTDTGGGPLKGLDVRGMVVALDSQRGQPTVTDVDDAGVLAGSDHHPRCI